MNYIDLMYKISIITTTYNHEDFIVQTIESVIAQTYTNWELLIGDDSSDDTSRNIIQSYVTKYPNRIRAWRHKPNKGIVDNMNFLIEMISGDSEYISFLEWDDMYTPNNLEEKIKVFKRYPEIGLVYSDFSLIDKGSKIILSSFFWFRWISVYKNRKIPINEYILSWSWPICSRSTSIIRRSIAKKYLPIFNLIPSKKSYSVSDRDFYFRVSINEKVYFIKKPLTQYRRHSNNLSWASGWTSADLELLINDYKKNNLISDNLYRKKLSRIYIVYSVFSLEAKNKHKAIQDFKTSISFDMFSFLLWKIWVLWLLILPIAVNSYILKKLIKRG